MGSSRRCMGPSSLRNRAPEPSPLQEDGQPQQDYGGPGGYQRAQDGSYIMPQQDFQQYQQQQQFSQFQQQQGPPQVPPSLRPIFILR